MSFIGNLNGPKESEIIDKLGASYFGILSAKLEEEISHKRDAERRNEVVPIRIDNSGEPYIIFSSPDEKKRRFYLRTEGYNLRGRILCLDENGDNIYMDF